MQIEQVESETGATIVDFGVNVPGGLTAGIALAEICMANCGTVSIARSNLPSVGLTSVQVTTDRPALACMASQYAGWPLQVEDYFAMCSGPMRLNRGQEPVLEKYFADYGNRKVIGVLESDNLPSDAAVRQIARECSVETFEVSLCIAPTKSIAGMIQIVARSVEATMHKLFELNFDLNKVQRAWGIAPLPPPSSDSLQAIGRTNDAILYGGQIELWLDADDAELKMLGQQLPSQSSKDYGKPFKQIFAEYDSDFYAIDKMLFSAAEITLNSLQSGQQVTVGEVRTDILEQSFGS